MLYLGIDPGAAGGIAAVDDQEGLYFRATPKDERGIPQVLRAALSTNPVSLVTVVIEQVGGYHQGARGNIGSAMFSFGRNFGVWLGCLYSLGIRPVLVHPLTWQGKIMGRRRQCTESKEDWKRTLRDEAQRLYPRLKVTLATADALLLAHYGKLTLGSKSR